MRVIVVGCGSIGGRHLANLASLGVEELVVCDPDEKRRRSAAATPGVCGVYADLEDALRGGADCAFICSPTSFHLEQAEVAARAGVDLFVEKPLSHTLEGVEALVRVVRSRGIILMVGMCYRFHPGLRELKSLLEQGAIGSVLTADMWAGSYLPHWHPQSDYRKEYSAQSRLGGGVILDSIHSFDTLRWLFGEPAEVACRASKISDLEIDTEDVAAVIAVMEGGAIVQVHVDYLQQPASSRIEVVGSRGKAIWEAGARAVRVWSAQPQEAEGAGPAAWRERPYTFEVNDMYVAEIREFLACVRERRRPVTCEVDGLATLRVAIAAKEASTLGRFVRLAPALEPASAWSSVEAVSWEEAER